MKKKWMAAAAAVMTAGMLITGCGGETQDAQKESGQASEAVRESRESETEPAFEETAREETDAVLQETESAREETALDIACAAIDVTGGEALVEPPAEGADDLELADWGVETMKAANFYGDIRKLEDVFRAYDEQGSWRGVVSKQGDISVFYDGEKDGEYYAMNFMVAKDGTFSLTNVTMGDSMLEGDEAVEYVRAATEPQ